jgi:activator of HSP90 ATPase
MYTSKTPEALSALVTRRRAMAGIALVFAGIATGSRSLGDAPKPMQEAPGKPENQKRTSIHQEVDFKAPAGRLYEALLDSRQFAAFSGMPAEIDRRDGGAFSMFGGMIVGRNIELVPEQRVVQAWRPAHWDAGIYSIARFELRPRGPESTVVFDHTGFPEGDYDSLLSGWNGHYWKRLAKFLE